jgi:predicted amidohydrolase
MKISVAQTRPVKGDVQSNIDNHRKLIDLAVSAGADVIIFPELSLTGYEPYLAQELATHRDDDRFDVFQRISDAEQITIGVGMPTKTPALPCITMLLFQPHKARQTYSKKHLHSDEELFFASGQNSAGLMDERKTALAICYELSIAEHAANAFQSGAEIYAASVAKTAEGVGKAAERLSDIARRYSMTVLMSNCVGPCDNFESAGRTSVWNNKGALVAQLDDASEGVIIFNVETQEITERAIRQ